MTEQTDVDRTDPVVVWGPQGRRLRRSENRAIALVASQIAADLLEQVSEAWESYPEIGEHDWEDIVDRVQRIIVAPAAAEYHDAYALLTARAAGNGADA